MTKNQALALSDKLQSIRNHAFRTRAAIERLITFATDAADLLDEIAIEDGGGHQIDREATILANFGDAIRDGTVHPDS